MSERLAPEQHDTLDGVPEPSENPHLFGHDAVKAQLAATYRSGKLPHALILSGPRGIGKATLAFHLANHLISHPKSSEAPDDLAAPDPGSALFRQIAMGAHPAVLHLTRPANEKTKNFKTVLTVDEIRRVNRFLSMTSHDGSYRVVIVDPADDMNTNAANALLKNLEEPPARTIFVLIAHSQGSLLPTIRSRCQMIRLAPLDRDSLVSALEAAGIAMPESEQARAALAERASGSVRSAIMLTEYGGIEIAETVETLARAGGLDIQGAHRLAEAVAARGEDARFDIFNEHVLEILSTQAAEAAGAGRLGAAARLSEAWQEARKSIIETDGYNLDRKQHALTLIDRLNAAMRM